MAKNLPDELADMGKEILRDVSTAIEKNDYSKLASDIANTVKAVTVTSIDRRTTYASGRQNRPNGQQYSYQRHTGYAPYAKAKPLKPVPFLMKRVSRYNGAGSIIFGSIGAVCLMPMSLAALLVAGANPLVAIPAFLFLFCVFQIIKGTKKLNLTKKFYEYGQMVGEAEYFEISKLASRCLKTDKEVIKELKAMIKAGYLPRARFDATEKNLMITDNAYNLYIGAEKDKLEREKKALEQDAAKKAVLDGMSSEVRNILEEGDDYIKFVRKINDVIPDTEEMSDKLYRLEEIMNRIFTQVKKDNQSADELHKLMNYYLPTTRKLLSAYVELDKQPDAGENIVQTKKEISQAMDTINMAFEKLLDSMFQDMAWDISSDISVMKTMMAQDGLTESGVAMQMKE